MYHQLFCLQTMRNYEFVNSIKSRDITHSFALFLKSIDKPILKCFKIALRSSILMQAKCFDIKQVTVSQILISS